MSLSDKIDIGDMMNIGIPVKDIKEAIKELNTCLDNWEGDLTPQIVKEIIDELAGKELTNG